MKKIMFFFFMFVVSFSVVSSIDIELKNEFVKGEPFIAKISGNFVKAPLKENIEFFRDHESSSMGFFDFFKLEGDYYLYVNIPLEKNAGNYSMIISGAEYYLGTEIVNEDLVANFTILEEQASFSIAPAIFVAEEDYSIELRNLIETQIEVFYEKVTKEEVVEEEGNDIGFFEALFGSFEPVEEEVEEETKESIVLKSGEIIEVAIPIGNYTGFEKVEFTYENESYHSLAYIYNEENIENQNVIEVNETDFENETGDENQSEVNESVTEVNETDFENETEDENQSEVEPCGEYGGLICQDDEKCEGETEYSATNICCLGECVKKEESNLGKTIGWIIIIGLALFLTWFFKKKYRGAKPKPVDLEEESKKNK
ncbi:MAG TPA: hypothetical protein VJ895_02775 [Candidatus Nanoarchaeia archaeon]|nr:hypothetical protein [Candidatus Nanoarchaeia archaeon]